MLPDTPAPPLAPPGVPLAGSGPASALDLLDEAGRAEYWASLALRHAKGLGARSIRRLAGHFGSALAALRHIPDWSAAVVSPQRGASITDESWRLKARPEWDAAKKLRGRIILWTDPLYPPLLRETPDAPLLLYVLGDASLLHAPCLAIVGKRQCSSEGIRASAYFARSLAEAGVTVVSGLARGVDQAAHCEAVTRTGRTIAVLGTGLDVPYPAEATQLYEQIAEHGLLVSELPPGTPPMPGNFPVRNRIISGLSLGVLVVEAAPRSGSLITARLALEQNRTVFAVPGALGAPTAQGCQELIRQGAKPVFAAYDVILELFPQLRDAVGDTPPPPQQTPSHPAPASTRKPTPRSVPLTAVSRSTPPVPQRLPDLPASGPEARLLEALRRVGAAASIDLLDDALDLSAAELSALLVRMEVQGRIRRLPGHYYIEASHEPI